jgi:RimJ/RimL family protein N-acetyltransferase
MQNAQIQFIKPNIDRDASFAFAWFDRPEGKQTLLSMGNAENEITPPTLEGEIETLKSFISMEAEGIQTTRMIRIDNKTVGAVWIEWTENHEIQPPSIHILVGDPAYRGKGAGTAALRKAIEMVYEQKPSTNIYSRHLVSNAAIANIMKSLGFTQDGTSYADANGLQWQNIVLLP